GHKVKVTIMFRGREMAHPELGKRILDHVAEEVVHLARVEVFPKLDGRNMIMVLAPDKKAQAAHAKALEEAQHEAAAAAQEEARIESGGAAPAADVSSNAGEPASGPASNGEAPGVAPATPDPEATTASTEAEATAPEVEPTPASTEA
ncbi:MAG TPA: translation initiation factor IF-3 C-terminal domain-containing protein, partial [Iamia sp.]